MYPPSRGPVESTDHGRAYLLHGPISGTISLDEADIRLRSLDEDSALGGAGDLDGDGLDEVLVGAPCASTVVTLAGPAYLV